MIEFQMRGMLENWRDCVRDRLEQWGTCIGPVGVP